MTTALSGMKQIQEYCRSISLASSESSIIKMITDYGFPARKLCGIWESDKEYIVEWRKKLIKGEINVDEKKTPVVKVNEKQPNSRRKK
ncbi:MAG TPA: hypothetical protein DDY86_02570 [Syntrophaceae bacterium]|nr:hypothetical protein [Syntrophaceae bacterium]